MFYGEYPEYPESALIFYFNRSDYLKPEEQKQFFKKIHKKFGKNAQLRSFNLFQNAFHEVSFWIDESKVGSILQNILCKIRGEPKWMLIDGIANDLATEISEKFDLQIRVRVVEVNKKSRKEE